jgi:hypothetical protein
VYAHSGLFAGSKPCQISVAVIPSGRSLSSVLPASPDFRCDSDAAVIPAGREAQTTSAVSRAFGFGQHVHLDIWHFMAHVVKGFSGEQMGSPCVMFK